MSYLYVLRHGQSVWNAENRFTGFKDVELSSKGRVEAVHAGAKMKNRNLRFDAVFTSTLRRAYETAEIALGAMTPLNDHLKREDGTWGLIRHDDLRERDYGELMGMNKDEIAQRYGPEQVQIWRRGFAVRPPGGESLEDVVARVGPYFDAHIRPHLAGGENILIVAHGNSLRALNVHLGIDTATSVVAREFTTGEPIEVMVD